MTTFRPTSGDTERVFSRARISEKFLQSRLTPDNHNRNVFMKKKNIIAVVKPLDSLLNH